jgi:redox-regulated HSP33 family molecular chaperone
MSLLFGVWPIQSRSQSPSRRVSVWRDGKGEIRATLRQRSGHTERRTGEDTHRRPIVTEGSFSLAGS